MTRDGDNVMMTRDGDNVIILSRQRTKTSGRETMTRNKREASSSDIYHVIVRGAGRRLLFEDDEDRRFFIERLFACVSRKEWGADLLAWCLMENHVHLLLRAQLEDLESMMRSLNTSFARYYNGRHGHVGPVFQDRYKSIPVETDVQLLETVRYIHHNPQVANVCGHRDYKWSSFKFYLEGHPHLKADAVLDMLGGEKAFIAFHDDVADDQKLMECVNYSGVFSSRRRTISDGDAIEMVKKLCGNEFANSIATAPKGERDSMIGRLRGMGLSVRQIERLTGIGRGIIQKCPSSSVR